MKVFIASDHNGFDYKAKLTQVLAMAGHEVVDKGPAALNPDDDYPTFAAELAHGLLNAGPEARGILICGSGQGVCMAANRFKGIRSALCWNIDEARAARNDDDANILCLSARYTTLEDATSIMATFLNTPFAGAPRFTRRIQQLDQLG